MEVAPGAPRGGAGDPAAGPVEGGGAARAGAAAMPTPAAMAHPVRDIFISYAWGSVDPASGARPLQERARRVAASLQAAGYTVWLDLHDMHRDIVEAMTMGISQASAVVVCLSDAYALSANCRREARYAEGIGKPLFFVNVGETPDYTPASYDHSAADNVRQRSWLEVLVDGHLWADARTPAADGGPPGMSTLLAALGREPRVRRSGAPAPATAPAPAPRPASPAAPPAPLLDASAVSLPLFRIAPDGDVVFETEHGGWRRLGRGTEGDVFAARLHGQRVAVKVLRLDATPGAAAHAAEDRAEVLREAALHFALRHASIAPLLGVLDHPAVVADDGSTSAPVLGFVVERADRSLEQALAASALVASGAGSRAGAGAGVGASAGAALSLAQRLRILAQVASALSFLHAPRRVMVAGGAPSGELRQLVHGDIKPGNVLLSSHGGAWLADFGCSRERRVDASTTTSLRGERGTPLYMAPELADGSGRLAPACDVYSLGIMAWQVITGQLPFAELRRAGPAGGLTPAALYAHVRSGGRPDLDAVDASVAAASGALARAGVGARLRDLLPRMWAAGPDARITADVVAAELDVLVDVMADDAGEARPAPVVAPPPALPAPPAPADSRAALLAALEVDPPTMPPLAVLQALRDRANDAEVAELACSVLRVLAQSADVRLQLARAGAVSAAVAVLRRHEGHQGVAEGACGALCNLSLGADACALLATHESAVQPVVAALRRHEGSARVAEAACAALRNLALIAENAVQMERDGGVVPLLIATLRRHEGSAVVAAAACAAVCNIASDGAMPSTRERVAPALVGALRRHADNLDVALATCRALRNMCATEDPDCHALLARAGAPAAILAALRLHEGSVDLAELACGALLIQMAANGGIKALLVRDGAVPVLVSALRRHVGHAAAVKPACFALSVIAGDGSDDGGVLLARAGAAPVLVEALRRNVDSADVAEAACRALHNMAMNAANQAPLARGGAPAAIIAALRRHDGNAALAATACNTLLCLAMRDGDAALLAREGAGAAIVATMRRHEDNATIATGACRALWSLAGDAENRIIIAREGAPRALIAALRRHEDSAQIAEAACNALRNLAANDSIRVQLAREGAVSQCESVLCRHASNAAVARAAQGVLMALRAMAR